jgi:hypothetical protein
MGSLIWTIIVALSTIGGLLAYLFLWPNVEVSEGPHPADESPIVVPFSVKNAGFVTVYPQQMFCIVEQLKFSKGSVAGVTLRSRRPGVLKGGDTVEFTPKFDPFPSPRKVTSAEVLIVVRYRLPVWRGTFDRRVRFSVNRDSEGKLRYLRQYLSKEERKWNPEAGTVIQLGEPPK